MNKHSTEPRPDAQSAGQVSSWTRGNEIADQSWGQNRNSSKDAGSADVNKFDLPILQALKAQFNQVLADHKVQYAQKDGRTLDIDKLCNVMFLSGLVVGRRPEMKMNYVVQKVDLVVEDHTTTERDKMAFLYNTLPLKSEPHDSSNSLSGQEQAAKPV